MSEFEPEVSRRDLLKGVVGAAAAASVAPIAAAVASDSPQKPSKSAPFSIPIENQKPGHADWQLTRARIDSSPFRMSRIEGYCSAQSVAAGGSISIMVSTRPAAPFLIEIFRMGYYGGTGARLMKTIGPLNGTTQPEPPIGDRRLRECNWTPSTELTIPADWPSGVYLGRLTLNPEGDTRQRWQNYVIFIVTDDRPAEILFQCSDNTWQAYNRWPDDYSLYIHPEGPLTGKTAVSFDRPYGKYCQIYDNPMSFGSGEFLCWEYPLCYWLEMHGYDVSYCGNSDMIDPQKPLRHKTFISVGHDEYWDLRQYDTVMQAIHSGVNAFFLSGNSVCFVSPFQPSGDGRPNRIITRAARYGGLTETEKAHMGPFEMEGPNEGLLMGARTVEPFNGGDDWTCVNPDHWLFAGTGMKNGDRIPGLVGWEFHGNPPAIPGLEILAEGNALNSGDVSAHWTATIYPGPKGNFVWNASTIWWAQGLSFPPGHMLPWSHWVRPHGPDPRVQKITANALTRAGCSPGSFPPT
jgi:hypothetical protein